jgi:hypothetical protein
MLLLAISTYCKKHVEKQYISLVSSLDRHPDKNSDPAAENRFVEINQAYEVRFLLLHMKGLIHSMK